MCVLGGGVKCKLQTLLIFLLGAANYRRRKCVLSVTPPPPPPPPHTHKHTQSPAVPTPKGRGRKSASQRWPRFPQTQTACAPSFRRETSLETPPPVHHLSVGEIFGGLTDVKVETAALHCVHSVNFPPFRLWAVSHCAQWLGQSLV